ncbi:MAG: ABC transporter permease [Alphaproteobacteria bacterium]|jgi:spermidine/putrescine transport system permease protein|uniref:ABC transporter permease n=1 Tax=Pacificispira sp. TaxID=2888761 RepID=UPI002E9D4DE2|nr:ABC transporter permease [Pseudomonadota bacterium]
MKIKFLTIYAVGFMVFLYLPVLFLPIFSFNDSAIVAFPLKGFTLQWYENLANEPGMHQALINSLKVGIATSVISTILGICGARAVTRYEFFAKKSITSFVMLPLVLPEILVAISMLVVLLQLGFSLSLISVALGHILMCVPFSMAILISSFEGFDQSLEEASMDLGEGPLMTFFRVTLPVVAPGIVSSLLITFTISLDEFIVAFFLSGTEPTLPIFIWGQLRFIAKLPNILALGSLMLLASFILLCAAEYFRRRAQRRTGTEDSVI